VLFFAGCTCDAFGGCKSDIGGSPEVSGRIAGDLWEAERIRTAGETLPNTAGAPDTLTISREQQSNTDLTEMRGAMIGISFAVVFAIIVYLLITEVNRVP
jgi:hypothetical protein